MSESWIRNAQEKLLQLRSKGPGWGYREGGQPCAEPTVLACLGLLACGSDGRQIASRSAVRQAADWLAAIQQVDGSVGLSETLSGPRWPTAYALLLWSVLGGYHRSRSKAVTWLLGCRGKTLPEAASGVLGHDGTIVGWPWVDGTHSWLEPTAIAILVLRREGLAQHPRVQEGLRLICDRSIRTGGWNYGNSSVFGKDLRPRAAPTGLALLALVGIETPSDVIKRACDYLQAALLEVRSPQSLCWGLLGLTARNLRPQGADTWLSHSYRLAMRRSHDAPELSYLLLGASHRSLRLMGIGAEKAKNEGPR